jgi:hypothetical protein
MSASKKKKALLRLAVLQQILYAGTDLCAKLD